MAKEDLGLSKWAYKTSYLQANYKAKTPLLVTRLGTFAVKAKVERLEQGVAVTYNLPTQEEFEKLYNIAPEMANIIQPPTNYVAEWAK